MFDKVVFLQVITSVFSFFCFRRLGMTVWNNTLMMWKYTLILYSTTYKPSCEKNIYSLNDLSALSNRIAWIELHKFLPAAIARRSICAHFHQSMNWISKNVNLLENVTSWEMWHPGKCDFPENGVFSNLCYALQALRRRKKIHSRLGKGVEIPHTTET